MDLHKLIDLALATPQIGVINLSILNSLLHIIVQHLKLDTCKIEFDGDFAREVESIRANSSETAPLTINKFTSNGNVITEFERPNYTIVKTESSDPNPGDIKLKSKHIEIKREYSPSDGGYVKVENSDETTIEPLPDAKELKIECELIRSISKCSRPNRRRSWSTPADVVEDIIDDIVSTATGVPSPPERPSQRTSCVRRVLNDILSNVHNAEQPLPAVSDDDDPFVRRSEIEALIEKSVANRFPPDTDSPASPPSPNEIYENIQKLLNDSQLIENKVVAYDIRRYFEKNVEHLCNKLERFIKAKFEMENDSVNDIQSKASSIDNGQLKAPVPKARQRQNVNRVFAKPPPNVPRPTESKRMCGGRHTLTTPASRVMRRGKFEEQYIDLMAQQMKDQLERKKKPPANVFRNINFNSANICNCNMDAYSGFIICGTASRRKFE